jgi:two-component system, NtrC family, response regulator HydG
MKEKILIVDDEESIRFTFQDFLEEAGYTVASAPNYWEAVQMAEKTDFDLFFIDIVLDGKTGIDLLRSVRKQNPNCQVIIVTGAPTVETASEALRLGALDYIVKPVRQETLLRASSMAFKHKALTDAKEEYRMNMEAILRSVKDGIISVNRNMKVVELNDAADQLCRMKRDHVCGKTLPSLMLPCSKGCFGAMIETLEQKQSVKMNTVECKSMGRPDQVVSITASPLLNQKNDFVGAVMVVKDQTRLMRLERSLKAHRDFDKIIGKSREIQKIFRLVKNVAQVQSPVLLMGESGTGKELVADSIHEMGDRSEKALVKVNCSALVESLLESELFGHVRGAFTGATEDKIGRFQRADGGTIFLDEIGDISPAMQLRFLRILENMEIERVGDSRSFHIDARVIAATNRDLQEKVLKGEFREDLFYRLKVVEIKLPPLRERRDDIPLLLKHFLAQFNKKFGKRVEEVSSEVRDFFMRYNWPGNVRELKNTLEHAFILCNKNVITIDELPPEFVKVRKSVSTSLHDAGKAEAQNILQALAKSNGNKSRAAKALGISRRTIYRKIHQHKLTF